jgi:hypothetical protein
MPDTNLVQPYRYVLKSDELTFLYLWNPTDAYCTNKNYFDDATLWTPTASATITVKNFSKPPLSTSTTYTPNGVKGISGQNRGYIDVTTTATAQSVTFNGPSLSRVNDSAFRIGIRNSAASKAMTVKYTDGSNSETFNITTPSTANTWAGYTFKKGTGTLVGTMNYANPITITVGDTSSGANYSVAFEYSAPLEMHFPGSQISDRIPCLDDFKAPYIREVGQYKCGNSPTGSFPISEKMEIELSTSVTSPLLKAMFLGLYPRTESVTYTTKLAEFQIATISASGVATLTVPSGLNIANVVVDGLHYQPTEFTAANIDEGTWIYSGTTLTIGPGIGTGVGKTVTIFVNTTSQVSLLADYGELANPLVGYLQKNITLAGGGTTGGGTKVLIIEKVSLDSIEESGSIGDQTKFTFKMTAITTGRGNLFKEFVI